MSCETRAQYGLTWLEWPGQPELIAEIWQHKTTCPECIKDKANYDEWRQRYYAEKQMPEAVEADAAEEPGTEPAQPDAVSGTRGYLPGVPEVAVANGGVRIAGSYAGD